MRIEYSKKFICYFVSFILTFQQPLVYAASNIKSDSAASLANRATIYEAQNGISIVEVVAPNKHGVSHNKFTDYNVAKEGVVINNSLKMDVSILGGAVIENRNFNDRSASLIMNEVTSSNRSKLLGYTEIFGDKADLIIANPNGIYCSGCGFINTDRLNLITGKPQYDADNDLARFNIGEGSIIIGELGMDAKNVKASTLVTKIAQLRGTIWGGNELNIQTGNDYFDAKTKEVFSKENLGEEGIAIDASYLGSMYAGRISLIATEEGFGVKSDANLVADLGQLEITADGAIEFKNIASKNNINVTSHSSSITSNGDVYTEGVYDINAKTNFSDVAGETNVEGEVIIQADNDVSLSSSFKATSVVTIEAEKVSIDESALVYSEEDINIFSDLDNSGYIVADNVTIESGLGDISNAEDAEILAASLLSLTSLNVSNDGSLVSGDELIINASNIDSSYLLAAENSLTLQGDLLANSGVIKSNYEAEINITDFTNLASGSVIAANNLNFDYGATSIVNSGEILAGLDLVFDAENLSNSGLIYAENNINFSVDELTNDYIILANNDLTISSYNSDYSIFTNNALIRSEGNLTINPISDLANSGIINSQADLTILAVTINNNSDSVMYSSGNMTMSDFTDFYNYGTILSDSDFTASNFTQITNNNTLLVNGLANIQGDAFTNYHYLEALGNLTFTLEDDLDNDGEIFVGNNFTLVASSFNNENAEVDITGSATIDIDGDFDNDYGRFVVGDYLNVTANLLSNNYTGAITDGSDLTSDLGLQIGGNFTYLNGKIDNNNSGNIIVSGTVDVVNLSNNSGYFGASGGTIRNNADIDDNGDIFETSLGTSDSKGLDNEDGRIEILSADGELAIYSTEEIDNKDGYVGGLGSVFIGSVGDITASGAYNTDNNLTFMTNGNFSNKSNLEVGNDLTITSLGEITNSSSYSMNAGGGISLSATSFIDNYSDITALGAINIDSETSYFHNRDGALLSSRSEDSYIDVAGDFKNDARAEFYNLDASSLSILNYGQIAAQNDLILKSSSKIINYANASMIAINDAYLYADTEVSNLENADIYVGHDLEIANRSNGKTSIFLNRGGNINVENRLLASATTFINRTNNVAISQYVGYIAPKELDLSFAKKNNMVISTYTWDWWLNMNSNSNYDDDRFVYIRTGRDGAWAGDRIERSVRQYAVNSALIRGSINAGGNINISATNFRNLGSDIKADGNLSISATNITNTSYEITDRVTYTCYTWTQTYCTSYNLTGLSNVRAENNPAYLLSIGAIETNFGNDQSTTFTKVTDYVAANIHAGGGIYGSIRGRIDNNFIAEGKSSDLENIQYSFDGSDGYEANGRVAPDIKLAEGEYGLFKTNFSFLNDDVEDTDDVSDILEESDFSEELTSDDVSEVTNEEGAVEREEAKIFYISEKNTDFIDLNKFMASDYFFNLIGFNPEEDITVIGDGFYEHYILEKSLDSISVDGKLGRDDVVSSRDMIAELYKNGADFINDLKEDGIEISPGVTMSKDLIASLQQDIIWYETQIIEGREVLVPVIYVTEETQSKIDAINDETHGSVIAAAGEIDLEVDGTISNQGSIVAGGDLNITAGEIISDGVYDQGDSLKRASLQSGGDLTLLSDSDITLDETNLVAAEKLTVLAKNKVSITSKLSELGLEELSSSSLSTTFASIDDITDAVSALSFSSGSDILISALGDITIETDQINSGGSIYVESDGGDISNSNRLLQASSNIVMSANNIYNNLTPSSVSEVSTENSTIEAGGIVSLTATESIENIGGEIIAGSYVYLNAGEDITNSVLVTRDQTDANNYSDINHGGGSITGSDVLLVAGGEINMEGGTISATDDLYLDAAGDINIATETVESRRVETSKKEYNEWYSLTNVGSEVAAGGTVSINSGGDTTISGSSISSGNNTEITTSGSLNLISALNEEKEIHNFNGGKHSHVNELDGLTQVTSSLTSEGDINISSGEDTTIISGSLDASENIAIAAGEELNILSSENYERHYKLSSKKGYNYKKTSITETVDIAQVKGDLLSGTDLSTSSGDNTNIIASNLTAGGNITMQAGYKIDDSGNETFNETAELNITGAKDSSYSYDYYSTEEVDEEAVIVGAASAAAVTAATGGAGLAMATSMMAGASIGADARSGHIDLEIEYDETVVDSVISSGGNITLESGGNITLASGELESSSGDISIIAGEITNQLGNSEVVNADAEVQISALVEEDYEISYHETLRPDYLGVMAGAATAAAISAVAPAVADGFVGDVALISGAHAGVQAGTQMNQQYIQSEIEERDETIQGSEIASGQDLSIASGGDTTLLASNLISSGNLNISSEASVNIASAVAEDVSLESYVSSEFEGIGASHTRSSAGIDLSRSRRNNQKSTTYLTNIASNIVSDGNVSISSEGEGDINILGSNIAAVGDIDLNVASGDVNLASVQDSVTVEERNQENNLTVNAGIANSWVEAAYQAQETHEVLTDDSLDSHKGYANAASASFAMAKDGVVAVETLPSFGFSGSVSVSESSSTENSKTYTESNVASLVRSTGGDVSLSSSSGNLEITGSDILADTGNVSLSGEEVTISSGESLSNSSYSNSSDSNTVSVTLTASDLALSAVSSSFLLPTHNSSESESVSNSVTQSNSNITAENGSVTISSGGDTSVSGANIVGEEVEVAVGGDLIVESVADTSSSSSSSEGFSIGDSVGYNESESSGEKQWVSEQTSIIGRDRVAINVDGKTSLVGSVVANVDDDGLDGGNLQITTDELEISDVEEYNRSKENSFGIVTNLGVSTSLGGDQANVASANNAGVLAKNALDNSTISYSDGGNEKLRTSLGTIGEGTINVGGSILSETSTELANANRDITSTQTTITENIDHGYDVEIDIDMAIATGKILAEHAPEAAIQISEGLAQVKGSPVWVSRYIDDKNGSAPAPNLMPGFMVGSFNDSEMGRNYDRDSVTGKKIIPSFPSNLFSGTKANPVLKITNYIGPGIPSGTSYHDEGMKTASGVEKSKLEKAYTIVPYFASSYYGSLGTVMDVSRWKWVNGNNDQIIENENN